MRSRTRRFLAEHRRTRVDALTDVVLRAVAEPDAEPDADRRESARHNVQRILELLAAGPEAASADAPDDRLDAATATGRRRAAAGMPLDAVLASYRLVGRLVWDDLVATAEGTPDLRFDAESLREVGTGLWEVIDRISTRVAAAYHEVERESVKADEQRRAALWEELLNGRAHDPAFAESAALLLGLPTAGPFLAVALTSAAADVQPRLVQRGVVSAWHSRTDVVVGVLCLGDVAADDAVAALASVGGNRGGVSGTTASLTGIAEAFAEARTALRSLAPGDPHLVTFDERLTEALLLATPDLAARLVDRWLGPVVALPPGERDVLLATTRAWVECGGSMTRTSRAASCHRNTAMNRLARVGELIDRPLGEGVVPLGLELAFRALDLGLAVGQDAQPRTTKGGQAASVVGL